MSNRTVVGIFWNVYVSRFGFRVPSNVEHMLSKWTPEDRDAAIEWARDNMDPHKIELHEIRVYDVAGRRTAETVLSIVFEATPDARPTQRPFATPQTIGGRTVEQLELPDSGSAAA